MFFFRGNVRHETTKTTTQSTKNTATAREIKKEIQNANEKTFKMVQLGM